MLNLNVKYDVRELEAYLTKGNEKSFRKAVARSLNRTATTARKLVANQISRSLGGKVSPAKVKSAMPHMRRARPSESINTQEEDIGGEVSGLSLTNFRPKQTIKGVVFTVGGKAYLSPHSFLRKASGAKKKTAFHLLRHRDKNVTLKRGDKAYHSKNDFAELPIEQSTYKSIFKQMLEEKKVILVEKLVNERFTKELQSNVNYMILGSHV